MDGDVSPQADNAAPAEAPATTEPAPAATEPAAEATPSPAEVPEGEAPMAPAPAEGEPATADATAADAAAADAAAVDAATADTPAAEAAPEAAADEAAADAAIAPAEESPAAIQNPDAVQAEPAESDTAAATDTTDAAPADAAEAEAPAAEAEAAPSEGEAAAAEGEAAPAEAEAAPAEGEAAAAHATHQEIHDVAFSFEGPFGKFDQFQLQRGLQVYTEVCASCHGMKQVPLRTLSSPGGPGLPEDQVRAYAAAMTITDKETGEDRPRVPTDMFPTVTGEGMGPDLSLMAKARAGFHGPYGTGISQLFNGIGGPEYIYSVLTGYTGNEMEQAGTLLYENTAFPGGWISMPPPLSDDLVTFEDGSPADLSSAAKDLSAFLMWTAEPKMMVRKQAGLVSVLFLIVLSALLYLTNKRLWWPVKHRQDVPGDGR